jgi:hypothetical protein
MKDFIATRGADWTSKVEALASAIEALRGNAKTEVATTK